MTPEQLAELKDNATLRKRLAKKMVHDCFRNTNEREALALLLLKHAHAGEHTHDAIERGRVRTCFAGDCHGCRVHVVSDAEPRYA
jgi:hypothetical protein